MWKPSNGGLGYLLVNWNEQGHLLWKLCYLDLLQSFMVILEAMRGTRAGILGFI